MSIPSINSYSADLKNALTEMQALSKAPAHQLPNQLPKAQQILQNLNQNAQAFHQSPHITNITQAQAAEMHQTIEGLLTALRTVFPNYMNTPAGRAFNEQRVVTVLATLLPTLSGNLKKIDDNLRKRKFRLGDKVEKVDEAQELEKERERQ